LTAKYKVSLDGRITLPAFVRRQLGIKGGDEIEFRLEGDRCYIRKA